MKIKMYEILAMQNVYTSISNIKMPLKIAYKFTRLMRSIEKEIMFYQEKFREIVEDYGVKEQDGYKLTPDGQSIAIIPGKEIECNTKLNELRNLEVEIESVKFRIEDLENLNISIQELECLMPLIED